MAQQNIASTRIVAAKVAEAKTHLEAALVIMREFGIGLTPAQRSELPTIGQENSQMVSNGVALIQDNAGWFPADTDAFDRAEVLADNADRTTLKPLEAPVKEIYELFRDTNHAIGSDVITGVYAASPYIIQGSKLSGQNNDAVNQFRSYFKRNRARKPPTPPTP